MSCSGRDGAGLEIEVVAADAGSTGKSARCVGGGLEIEFASGVGVEQVAGEHAAIDDDGAAGGQAFAVEVSGAEAAGEGAVVDDGDVVGGDFFAELAGQEGSATVDSVSVDGGHDVADEAAGDFGREDDGGALGRNAAGAEAAEGAASGFFADGLGRFKLGERERGGVPVVALHLAVGVLGDGDGGDAAVAAAGGPGEAAGICRGRGCRWRRRRSLRRS